MAAAFLHFAIFDCLGTAGATTGTLVILNMMAVLAALGGGISLILKEKKKVGR